MARFLKFLAVVVVLYALAVFFVLPPIVKKQMEERLGAELQRSVSISRVRLNPFAISATVEGLEVSAPDGSASWLGWQRLYVNADPLKSFTGDWAIGRIALTGFHGAVEVREDGTLNFSDLIEKFGERAKEPSERSMWSRPVRIERLDVTNAQVTFTDASHGTEFETVIGPVNFALTKFRTEGSGGAAYRFEAASEAGERFEWMGTLVASPLASVGDWRIEKVQLAKYAPYLAERMKAVVVDGELMAGGSYEVSLAPSDRRVRLSNGSLQLKDVSVLERRGGEPVVEWGTLEVAGVKADALAPSVAVDSVRLAQGHARVRREADGTINLLAMLQPENERRAEAEVESAAAKGPIDVSAKEVAVSGFEVELRDEGAAEPVDVALEKIEATVTAFTLQEGAPMPVSVSFDVRPQGAVKVEGSVTLTPFQAVVGIDVARVAMAPFGGYLRDVSAAQVARGLVSVKGNAQVGADGGGTFAGEAKVEDFAVTAGEGEEIAGVREFTANDIKIATAPRLTLSTGELKLAQPFAHVVRKEDGTLNLDALMPPRAGNETSDTPDAADAEKSGGAAPEIAITRVLVQEGDFTFSDQSLREPVEYALAPVNGAVRNLSSLRPELGDAEIQARVNRSAEVRLLGRLNPLVRAPFVDVRLDVVAVDLMPASPYFGKFVGYELADGRLFVETRAKLEDERLDMSNAIKVERFALGEATNSPDAVKLPVKLGVALLKDAQGNIALDVPVQGSLADPQFEIGKVVGQVFSNLFTKAATSPFALLGSMFGGGGEELGQQEFVAGTAELTEESRGRLDVVRRALAARPALQLEIEAGFDRTADAAGLKQRRLDDLLRIELGESERGADGEQRELTPEERERGLRSLFQKRFPSGVAWERTVARAMEPPDRSAPPPATAREEEERRGFLRKTWDVATLKGARDWISGRSRREEEAKRAEAAARAQAEQSQRDALAARELAVPPQEGLEEMQRGLLASIAVEDEELVALADERANRVRELLVSNEGIEANRIAVKERTSVAQGVKGTRAILHLH